jgi:hemolysin activation/secretion protein
MRLGFDYKDVDDYLLDNLRSKDNIRELNLGMTCNFTDILYGRNIINLTYYQGLRGFLGGNNKNDPDASRMNADGGFSKFTADVVRVQKLPGYNYLMLKASGQFSDDNLFVAEQFMIGGVGSVRGFASSAKSGDKGYYASAELYLSPIFPETKIFDQKIGDTFKLVLFADHGGVFINDAQPGEDRHDYLTSFGAGIRIYAGKHISARIDYAVPNIDGTYKAENSATYVQLVFSF